MNTSKSLVAGIALAGAAAAVPAHANELTANAAVTNNYIWRGLTQSTNEPAVQGGVDFTHDSGLYVGTWVSNVQYESDDAYSYEHDMYFGYAGSFGENWTYDIGYLYYNYDDNADFDFGEVYGTIGFKDFSFSAYVLTNTEANDTDDLSFDAGETYYLSADYGFTILNGLDVGLHVGYHDGDFSEGFNGVDGDYWDYNVSISRGGFGFMITSTNADGDFATSPARDNDEVKFVVADRADYEWSRDVIRERGLDSRVNEGNLKAILLSPVHGAVDLEALAGWILEDGLPIRFQYQLHKLIWGPDRAGV